MSKFAAQSLLLPGGTPGEMMERNKRVPPGTWRWEARATDTFANTRRDRSASWQPVWTQFVSDVWKKYQGSMEECIAMVQNIHPWWFAQEEWQFRITDGKEVIPMELFT